MDDRSLRIGELWAGHIYGTNTGKIFLELTGAPNNLSGKLRVADDLFGVTLINVAGSFRDGLLQITGQVQEAPDGLVFGDLSAKAKLQPNGSFSGEWESTIGTGGAFQLFPHTGIRVGPSSEPGLEQVYTVSKELGALALYRDDILQLIRLLERDFHPERVIVAYVDRGTEIARYASDFETHLSGLDNLQSIKLTAQLRDAPGVNRIATIDVGQSYNRIVVQGPEESWVLGEAESLASHLRKREKQLYTRVGKYHVGLNQVVALGALVAMPELPFLERAIFIVTVVIFLAIAERMKRKLIPNLSLQLRRPNPSMFSQAWPSIVSLLISIVAGVASALIFKWLA